MDLPHQALRSFGQSWDKETVNESNSEKTTWISRTSLMKKQGFENFCLTGKMEGIEQEEDRSQCFDAVT